MATRNAAFCLILAWMVGCQSAGRTPVSMVPPAPLDERPRPTATAAPRGEASGMLSTAAAREQRKSGEEEATADFPVPPMPKDIIETPKVDLPPAPVGPITVTPPPLPQSAPPPMAPAPVPSPRQPAPTPLASPDPGLPSFTLPGLSPATSPANAPSLAPPIPVEPKSVEAPPPQQPVEIKPVSIATPTNAPVSSSKIETTTSSEFTAPLRAIFERGNSSIAGLGNYTMRMRRREVVGGGTVRPEEIIVAKFRKEPFSIYLKWVGDEGKNREVCYVKGQHDSLIHILMGPNENFLFANKHLRFTPDHPMVKSNCRYPIQEAGLGPLVARYGRLVAALDKGDNSEGTARYLGKVKRPEFEEPVEGVVQTLPPKYENMFPAGGQRTWYFDTKSGLPVLINTFDERGREIEYYCHDRIITPANLDSDDFNPDKMWKSGK